jgi:hypothetical protein
MPVLRYFVFVGGALLALLFVCNAVVAPVPLPATLKSGSDLPTIRIRSERKWPERVVIDTTVSRALVETAQADAIKADIAKADLAKAAPALQASTLADTQKTKVREAFAQMGTAAPKGISPAKLIDNGAIKAAEPATLKVADAVVPKVTETKTKPEPSRTEAKPKRRIAKAHASRPMMLVAQQPQPHFGFFDSIW